MNKECNTVFPDISESEFYILFAACQKNREETFSTKEELISLK